MGIKIKYLEFLYQSLKLAGIRPPFTRLRMCELGNQIMKYNGDPGLAAYVGAGKFYRTGKEYFELHDGFHHTSLDINGKDGAESVDLTLCLPPHLHGFDVVTNFGTTEHIVEADQSMVFYNIHQLMKVGGIVVHIVPLHGGSLAHHGKFQYTPQFLIQLIDAYKYSVLAPIMERESIPGCLSVSLRKT
jgi:hypothetical protein